MSHPRLGNKTRFQTTFIGIFLLLVCLRGLDPLHLDLDGDGPVGDGQGLLQHPPGHLVLVDPLEDAGAHLSNEALVADIPF